MSQFAREGGSGATPNVWVLARGRVFDGDSPRSEAQCAVSLEDESKSEWQSFEQQHSEQVKAREVACKGYLPCASRNDQRLRDRLHRAGLGDDVIDEICSREDDFNDMLPSMG